PVAASTLPFNNWVIATRPLGTGTISTPGIRSARKIGADSMVVAFTAILICAFAAAASKTRANIRILVRYLGCIQHAQPVLAEDFRRRQVVLAQSFYQVGIVARVEILERAARVRQIQS